MKQRCRGLCPQFQHRIKTETEIKVSQNRTHEPSEKLLALVTQALENDKAEEIVTIDLAGKSSMADYMVIANGRSPRHVSAVSDHLIQQVKQAGHTHCRVEGQKSADWVLVDLGDIIVHVFRAETRSFYNLDKIWSGNIPQDSSRQAVAAL